MLSNLRDDPVWRVVWLGKTWRKGSWDANDQNIDIATRKCRARNRLRSAILAPKSSINPKPDVTRQLQTPPGWYQQKVALRQVFFLRGNLLRIRYATHSVSMRCYAGANPDSTSTTTHRCSRCRRVQVRRDESTATLGHLPEYTFHISEAHRAHRPRGLPKVLGDRALHDKSRPRPLVSS